MFPFCSLDTKAKPKIVFLPELSFKSLFLIGVLLLWYAKNHA
jgi:hypothetical protein